MSKEAWFREYERLIDNGAPHGTETAERALAQVDRFTELDRADMDRKKERGE